MVGLGPGGPPDRIPATSDRSLDYDELLDGEPLGQGGSADVRLVRIRRDGQEIPVAVKQPRFQGTIRETLVERFTDEADIWRSLDDHEHVVGVLDWGTEPLPWLAMEYMDGGSLADLLADGRLPVEQAAWVGLCVTRAVRHAHRHGVAHHDIKPSNVLFREPASGWLVPKVSDWGLARVLLDESGSIEGLSPQYAAPEQFDAEQYGPPDDYTDIYQIGTLVYECLTGRPPFEGSPAAVMGSVLSEQPAPPSAVADVPPRVDDVVMPALRTAKADRYDAVVYLRDELETLFEELYDGSETSATGVGGTHTRRAGVAGGTGSGESDRTQSATTNGADGTAEDSDGLLSRRAALGALGLGAVGLGAGVGGYLLIDPFGGTRAQPSAWNWLPEPGLVTGAEPLPFHVVQPAGSVTHYERYADPITGLFQSLPPGGNRFSLPLDAVETAIAASRLRVATGEFDRDALAETLASEGFDDGGEYGGQSILTAPDGRTAVGLSDGSVVVGRHTPSRSATAIVESAVDAGRGDATRYVEAGAAAFDEAVSDPEFAFWWPVAGAASDPDRGRFDTELGYGSVADFDDGLSIEYVRAFTDPPDDATLDAVEAQWPVDGETTVEDDTVRLTVDPGPDDGPVRFRLLTPAVRSPPADVDVDIRVMAQQYDFSYAVDGEQSNSFPGPLDPGAEYTVAFRSRDVVHGLAIEPAGVERAVGPGEQRVFTLEVGESDLTLQGSRYAGTGTEHMEAEIPVSAGGGGPSDVQQYLSNTSNYDGIVDRTGDAEVTVSVGVEGNGGNFAFGPPAVRVERGTTVTWEWTGRGSRHNVVERDGAFDSGDLVSESGAEFEYTFESGGTFLYLCEPHEALGMKGAVVVDGT